MITVSFTTGKLHKKTETKQLTNFPAGYVGRFYRDLANNTDSAVNSDFNARIANDVDIPSDDVQKYLLATTDFAKGMQDDINLYVTRDRLNNNASFRQKPDPISENIFRRQNLLELVFQDISTFNAQNPVVGSLLRELDIGKKDVTRDLVGKVPQPGGDIDIQKRLAALKNDNLNFNRNNNNDLSQPTSLPLFNNFIPPPPQPPRSLLLPPQRSTNFNPIQLPPPQSSLNLPPPPLCYLIFHHHNKYLAKQKWQKQKQSLNKNK